MLVNNISGDKRFLTIQEQRMRLEERGMRISDPVEVERWLSVVGYYRLSGYWYPYRQSHRDAEGRPVIEDEFLSGTTFERVVQIYEFDRRLKLRVLDAVERVEIAMRVRVGHGLGAHGTYAHEDKNILCPNFVRNGYDKWISKLEGEKQRSKEDFVKHYKSKHGGEFPVWVVTELLDFGSISWLYTGMQQTDRDDVAMSLNVLDSDGAGNSGALQNWMRNLNQVRNICAHHSRLWNRNIIDQLSQRHLKSVPELSHAASSATTKRVYPSLAVLAYLLRQIAPESDWRTEMANYLRTELAALGRAESDVGCPLDWRDEAIWN